MDVTCAKYTLKPKENSIIFPGIGVTGSSDPPYVCWEMDPGPLKELPVLLTTDPSLLGPHYKHICTCTHINAEFVFLSLGHLT